MKNIYIPFVLFFAVFILSCSGSKYTPAELKTGNYTFSMSDSTGTTSADGDMKLDTNSEGKVYGTYTFANKYVKDYPGLSTMGGTFSGDYKKSEGMVFLNMNPKLADANVFVNVKVYRSSLAGEWKYTTINGVKAAGKFVAKSTD
jgi:hypothetical protein